MIPARQLESASTRPDPNPASASRRFHVPDQLLAFDDGRLEIIAIGGGLVAKGSYAPGWRWSRCAAPQLIGTRNAPAHAGLLLSGRAGLRAEAGRSLELQPGDLFQAALTPEFDLWVVGSKPAEVLYLSGVDALVRRLRGRV